MRPLADLTSTTTHATNLSQHLDQCKQPSLDGYRPATISVAQNAVDKSKSTILTAAVWHRPIIPDEQKEILAKRQANAAIALLKMDRPDKFWPLLKHQSDPRLRSYVIHAVSPAGADPMVIVKRFRKEQDDSCRRALLLVLGTFNDRDLPVAERNAALHELKLLDVYRGDPDPGLHAPPVGS